MRKKYLLGQTIISLTLGIGCFFGSGEADAHPHFFITQRVKAVFDEKGLAELKFRWEFDEMVASIFIDDFDFNKNRKFEPNEVKSIKQNIFLALSPEMGELFCFILINNKPFRVKFIREMTAVIEKDNIVFEFVVPCHVSATEQFKEVFVATYDPGYYTVILFEEKDPLFVEAGACCEVVAPTKKDFEENIYYDMESPWMRLLQFRRKS